MKQCTYTLHQPVTAVYNNGLVSFLDRDDDPITASIQIYIERMCTLMPYELIAVSMEIYRVGQWVLLSNSLLSFVTNVFFMRNVPSKYIYLSNCHRCITT